MKKMLRISLCVVSALCLLTPQISFSQNCYALRVASSNLYLTNTSSALKVQGANNQADQIWKFEDVGAFVKIAPTSDNPAGTSILTTSNGKGVIGGPYTGQDSHLWEKKFIETVGSDTRYGFVSKNSLLAMGVENWGNGDPSSPNVSDINMVSSNDIYVFGANKWILENKTCPAPISSCDFNLSLSSSDYTPDVNENFTLTATCTGPGCSGVGYEWIANGSETSIYGMVQTVSMPMATTVDYAIKGEKAGCTTKYAHAIVNIVAPQSTNCDFNITATASNYTPIVGSNVTLTANCTGPGCSGLSYSWYPHIYTNTGSIYTVIAGTTNGNIGSQTFTVTAGKANCVAKSSNVTYNVLPYPGTFTACIESESSEGSGLIEEDPNASNGFARGDKLNYNNYVKYTVANVPAPGTYKVKLKYYSYPSAPVVTVTVPNTNSSQTITLVNSGSWYVASSEQTFNVDLVAGTNIINIQGVGGGSCRQDRICVSNDPNARTGVEEVVAIAEERLNISPNPSSGDFTVDFFLETGKSGDLTVVDMQGKVLQKRILTGRGNHREKIELGDKSPSGTYLVRIVKENGQEVKKAVIVK